MLRENLKVTSQQCGIRVISFDLWTFRDLDSFATYDWSFPVRSFSHLFDPSRFTTKVIFAVCCQLTVNYSLTTLFFFYFFFYLLLRRSISDHYHRSCDLLKATTNGDWGTRTGDLSAQSPRLYHCASLIHFRIHKTKYSWDLAPLFSGRKAGRPFTLH